MSPILEKALITYCIATTVAIGALLLGAAAPGRIQTFDEIRVHRVDVVEPNGTLRMVISNKDRLPGVIVKGAETPPSGRPQAGMIFYNDEGSESGGLIFGGHKNAAGEVVDSGGSLSFDKYGDNQIVQLLGVDDRNDRLAGLAVSDRNRRIWVGRADDGAAAISLMDQNGRKRIVMEVSAAGDASLRFLDADGRVVEKLAPEPR